MRGYSFRYVRVALALGALVLLVSGCAIQRLNDRTGDAYHDIFSRQARMSYSRTTSPLPMQAELGELGMLNLRKSAQKGTGSGGGGGGGGPTLIQLQR